jgi:putative DNA primase/helicase
MSAAVDRLRDALKACGCEPNDRGEAHCPAHEDRRASLTFREGKDGRALVTCHAGCNVEAITGALGLTTHDLFVPESGNGKRREIATYPYCDEAGELLYEVVRYEPKDFRQRRPDGHDGWVWKLDKDTRRVLYRLPATLDAIKAGRTVFVLEGEKDVQALVGWGCDATCNPGGAGKWRPEYSETLRGASVVIIPDADKPGRDHAAKVAQALKGVAARVLVVELPAKDAAAWKAGGGTPEELRALVERAAQGTSAGAPAAHGGAPELLTDPAPWPSPVDGAAVLDEVVATLARFVALSPGEPEAVALWIMHAHVHDAAFVSPILAALSPQKRCGKSTLLAVLKSLVPRALPAANISPAALFRAVENYRPTLLVDEADSFLKDSEELRGILNSGHVRTSATVVRCEGDSHAVKTFSTWAPKFVALIGRLPETLEDRSIVISMRRAMRGEVPERLRLDRLDSLAPVLQRLARWAADHLDTLRKADPEVPDTIVSDRARDNWRPLIGIADAAGGTWPRRAREAATLLHGTTEDESVAVVLLGDLRDLFETQSAERLASSEIAAALGKMEERPWPEWRDGKAITTRGVARLLKLFGIKPCPPWRDGDVSGIRGYRRSDFVEAWERYLPPSVEAQHPQHPQRDWKQTTYETNTEDEGIPRKSLETNECCAVADVAVAGRVSRPYGDLRVLSGEREPGDDDMAVDEGAVVEAGDFRRAAS